MIKNKKEVAELIKKFRNKCFEIDNQELKEKRMKFLGKLQCLIPKIPFVAYEMYPYQESEEGVIKSKPMYAQYLNECRFANTRQKIPSETCLEIDKLPFDKAVSIIVEVCLSLIRNNIHFAVFLAEGGRSPYVMIYDFEELNELTPFQRVKAQISFWRKYVPFGLFQYVDTGMFADEHLRPIEFSIHWKHQTPFNLLFEFNPYPPKSYEEMIKEKRIWVKKGEI